jgi:hypothetical protein
MPRHFFDVLHKIRADSDDIPEACSNWAWKEIFDRVLSTPHSFQQKTGGIP